MASCAVFVLAPSDAGGKVVELAHATLKMLGAPHSGFSPDVIMGIDDRGGPLIEWAAANDTFEQLFITKGKIGYPLMVNKMLDQVLELGDVQYDFVSIIEVGVVCEGPGWLAGIIESLSGEMSEYAYDIGRGDPIEETPATLQLGGGKWIVPNVGGMGIVAPLVAIKQWRAIPYGALYSRFWGELSDHFATLGTSLVYDESFRSSSVLVGRADEDTYVGYDGGLDRGE